jgi:hypothetical protein
MKRLLKILELSKNEQRIVLIAMLLLIIIAVVAYERRVHHFATELAPSTQTRPYPTAVEKAGDQ